MKTERELQAKMTEHNRDMLVSWIENFKSSRWFRGYLLGSESPNRDIKLSETDKSMAYCASQATHFARLSHYPVFEEEDL